MAATEASAALIRRDVARTDANFLICCRLPDLLPDLLSPAARAGRRLPHMAKRCARRRRRRRRAWVRGSLSCSGGCSRWGRCLTGLSRWRSKVQAIL